VKKELQVAQLHLSGKHETLSSNPSIAKKKIIPLKSSTIVIYYIYLSPIYFSSSTYLSSIHHQYFCMRENFKALEGDK
jgi:hypothetical protein